MNRNKAVMAADAVRDSVMHMRDSAAVKAGRVLGFMARDLRSNETVHGLEHTRRDLLAHCGRQHAAKMYQDNAAGDAVHVGYIIGGQWWQVYAVSEWQGVRP